MTIAGVPETTHTSHQTHATLQTSHNLMLAPLICCKHQAHTMPAPQQLLLPAMSSKGMQVRCLSCSRHEMQVAVAQCAYTAVDSC